MKPERWRQVDAVFQSAVDLAPEDRASYLDEACAGDSDLRRNVELLLTADGRNAGFIESPAFEAAAVLVAATANGLVEGTLVSRYRIHARIGVGGMGEVYRAEDTTLGRTVALKLLPPVLTADPQLRSRFMREARLASALDHPNVCTIHDVGRSGELLFIAMQYVEGPTLKEIVSAGPLGPPRQLSIARQVADGIAAAHAREIVHRDVKSSNIIVTESDRAVVLDFGLAKQLDEDVRSMASVRTRPGTVLGTPGYMAPEQARGDAADHRGDIFALGVVIYEMATGRMPFDRASPVETLTAVVKEPHVPLTDSAPSLPIALSALVDRALAKRPEERFQTMAAMRDALDTIARANE